MERLEQIPLSERAYQALKRHIIERQVGPQEKLDIQALSLQLGVSRMPIIDAITRLESEGLVQRHNRVGTYVSPLDLATYEEVFAARSMVEQWATIPAIANLSETDIQQLKAILQNARHLLSDVTEETFQYRQFIAYDQQFHTSLVQLSQNVRVSQFYASLDSHMQIARVYSLRALERSKEGQEEHEAILAAFIARDVEQACRQQQIHLERSRGSVLRLLEQQQVL